MKPFTLLLIDDIPNNIYTLECIIKNSFNNVKILSANSAKEGVQIVMKEEVDLILCDVQMPQINGLQLARYLHTTTSTKEIPIILISAVHNSSEYIKKGYEAGVVDYISKPIDDEVLCAKLKVFISLYEKQKDHKKRLEEQQKLLEEKHVAAPKASQMKGIKSFSVDDLSNYGSLVEHINNDMIDFTNINNLKKSN